jgi:hypothetical protein
MSLFSYHLPELLFQWGREAAPRRFAALHCASRGNAQHQPLSRAQARGAAIKKPRALARASAILFFFAPLVQLCGTLAAHKSSCDYAQP